MCGLAAKSCSLHEAVGYRYLRYLCGAAFILGRLRSFGYLCELKIPSGVHNRLWDFSSLSLGNRTTTPRRLLRTPEILCVYASPVVLLVLLSRSGHLRPLRYQRAHTVRAFIRQPIQPTYRFRRRCPHLIHHGVKGFLIASLDVTFEREGSQVLEFVEQVIEDVPHGGQPMI